jgi:intermembrane space import and assembly protein 40
MTDSVNRDMQNCFREYPEVYGSELEADDDDDEDAQVDAPANVQERDPQRARTGGLVPETYKPDTGVEAQQPASQASAHEQVSESERLVPKAAHDEGEEGTGVLERR